MNNQHETVKFHFADGFKAVRLNTAQALSERVPAMKMRLVMDGIFEDLDFETGEMLFISIRDADDNTVLTTAYEGQEIYWMTGPGGLRYCDNLASWLKTLGKKVSEDKPISFLNRVPHPAPSLLRHFQTVISHQKKDVESRARVRSQINAEYARLSEALGFEVGSYSDEQPVYHPTPPTSSGFRP